MPRIISTLIFLSLFTGFLVFHPFIFNAQSQSISFSYQNVFSKGTQGHALGDMDGDGDLDIVLAEGEFSNNEVFAWLEYPNWTVHNIDQNFLTATMDYVPDLAVADLDGDGDMDVILPNSHNSSQKSLWWWENSGNGGSFTRHTIFSADDSHIKDVDVADFDQDGKLDIVLRYENIVRFFYQDNARSNNWIQRSQSITNHEGMGVGDVNGDGLVDVVHNGKWLKNPGNRSSSWSVFTIDSSAPDSSRVAIGDIDGDGLADPVIGNSEAIGSIKWYKRSNDSNWIATTVQNDLNGAHTLQIADMDRDGDNDIVVGTLHSSNPGMAVYVNSNFGSSWNQNIVQSVTSYIGKVGDIDKNGAPDIMSSRSYDRGPIEVWLNQTIIQPLPLNNWTYITVDSSSPKGSVFGLTFADLNRDGREDILTGRYTYLNPGNNMTGTWVRGSVSENTDFKLTMNVDDDAYPDILGNGGDNTVRWYEPNDTGQLLKRKDVASMAPSQHSSGQGYVVADLIAGGKQEFALNGGPISGNGDPHSIFYFTIPTDPLNGTWGKQLVASNATGDGLAAADLDGDSDVDLLSALGTDGRTVAWWENNSWQQRNVGTLNSIWSDVTAAADLDQDGDNDIVVAKEGSPGEVYVFRNNENNSWTGSIVFTGDNTASLDIGDIDRDGDIDIIVGEHKGAKRVVILANNGSGGGWVQTVVGAAPNGGDNHLGTRLVDLDHDGDLDIVSIGYDVPEYVHLWRNNAISDSGSPLPSVTPQPISGVVAYYPLDETSGTQASDLSVNSYDASVVNGTWTAGNRGNALSLNGSNAYADAGVINVNGNALTLAAWIKPSNVSGDNRILSKAAGNLENDHVWMLSALGGSSLRGRLKTDSGTTTIVGGSVTNGQWTHVAMTYDGSTLRLYQNSQEVATLAKTGSLITSQDHFLIGANPNVYEPWVGLIDDVAIFSKTLSGDEIASLMQNGVIFTTFDLNADGKTNMIDIVSIMNNFGTSGSGMPEDIDGNGTVNAIDIKLILSNFGLFTP